MSQHRLDFKKGKNITSKYILELGDYEIVLLELYPCNSKDELHMRERYYIEALDCVNKQIPNRSQKEWCIKNKDKISEYQTEYRLNNKDKSKEYHKELYIKNKDAITENRKIKITCDCGKEVAKCKIARHKKSKRHIDIINNQSSL